eukprot:m.346182 g.346182  ORF g.346182 m.346182 type:complete len:241 (-) comp28321_c0_seq1:151-873(-)
MAMYGLRPSAIWRSPYRHFQQFEPYLWSKLHLQGNVSDGRPGTCFDICHGEKYIYEGEVKEGGKNGFGIEVIEEQGVLHVLYGNFKNGGCGDGDVVHHWIPIGYCSHQLPRTRVFEWNANTQEYIMNPPYWGVKYNKEKHWHVVEQAIKQVSIARMRDESPWSPLLHFKRKYYPSHSMIYTVLLCSYRMRTNQGLQLPREIWEIIIMFAVEVQLQRSELELRLKPFDMANPKFIIGNETF